MSRKNIFAWTASAALLTAWLVPLGSVHAQTTRLDRDRSDNTLGFSYEAADGVITVLTSSTRIDPDPDPVWFGATLANRPEAPEGRRLRGKVRLRLRGDGTYRYAGYFRFVVRDSEGDLVVRRTKARHITLSRDDRTAGPIRFRFDVPSGEHYTARARFVSFRKSG
jgi:hypothetical protein